MLGFIVIILYLFLLVLFAYSILSWVVAMGRTAYDSPVRKIQDVLARICEPVLRPIRRLISAGAGGRRGTRSVGAHRVSGGVGGRSIPLFSSPMPAIPGPGQPRR